MAIAPSKLGRLVAQEWHSDEALVLKLPERASPSLSGTVSDSEGQELGRAASLPRTMVEVLGLMLTRERRLNLGQLLK